MARETNASTSTRMPALQYGVLLAVAGAITFSLKPVLIKLIYQYHIAPEVLMTLRMAFAFPIFLLVGIRTMGRAQRESPIDKRAVSQAALVGILGYYCAALLDLLGLQYITAQFERMILFVYPTFVCLLGWLFFSERMSKRLLLALPLSYGGVVFIFLHDFTHFGSDAIRGSLFVLASAICFAGYMLFSKSCINKLGSAAFTCVAMGAASVVIAIHFAATKSLSDLLAPLPVLVLSFTVGVVATALPSFFISAAIGRIGSSRTSVVTSIGPLSTALLAVLILSESFTAYHAIGMAMTLTGVIYLSRENR